MPPPSCHWSCPHPHVTGHAPTLMSLVMPPTLMSLVMPPPSCHWSCPPHVTGLAPTLIAPTLFDCISSPSLSPFFLPPSLLPTPLSSYSLSSPSLLLTPYVLSEKNRFPAWCDRILYCKNSKLKPKGYGSHPALLLSDHKPVSALYDAVVSC